MSSPFLRASGVPFGIFPTTKHNHLADIEGIEIGHLTLHEEPKIHTGVTVVRPHGRNVVKSKAFAGFYKGNGYGKFAGSTQVEELGHIESYIGLTNTLAVGTVVQELVRYHIAHENDQNLFSLNVVVGETNDGFLNDIASLPIEPEHVHAAIADMRPHNTEQGSIGAGTGTRAFGFKGGIGSAARIIPKHFTKLGKDYHLGVLMQSNYGGFLTLGEVPLLWKVLGGHRFEQEIKAMEESKGSCIILVATDAPLLPHHLKRVASRAVMGLIKTGSFISHGSGDYALAWSTHEDASYDPDVKEPSQAHTIGGNFVSDESLDPFFAATVECVEEALWNSLTTAHDVVGFRGEAKALTSQKIVEILKDKKSKR